MAEGTTAALKAVKGVVSHVGTSLSLYVSVNPSPLTDPSSRLVRKSAGVFCLPLSNQSFIFKTSYLFKCVLIWVFLICLCWFLIF